MTQRILKKSGTLPAGLIGLAIALSLPGCGRSTSESQPATSDTSATDTAREQELKAREAAVAAKEAEQLAKQQQEEADQKTAEAVKLQREADAKAAAAKKAALAAKPPARSSTSSTAKTTPPAPVVAAPPVIKSVTVASGTQMQVALSSDLTSKTARAGDPFEAKVVSDIMVNDRIAVPAGSRVTGTITDVVSGSRAIGAVPMLGLKFDTLKLEDGQTIAITGDLVEQGKSEKGRDTAKILGGAAAGAILGHQVKKGTSGKVLGGLLGGAVGAVAAKKTGTEVILAAGSTLTITTGEAFSVKPLPAT